MVRGCESRWIHHGGSVGCISDLWCLASLLSSSKSWTLLFGCIGVGCNRDTATAHCCGRIENPFSREFILRKELLSVM